MDDTKDKTDPSNLQDIKTEEYNFSTSYCFDTSKISEKYIDRTTSNTRGKTLVGVS